MVRVEGQEVEGPREGQLPPDSFGNDRHMEYIQGVRSNAKSEGEEVHGAGNKIQKTGLSAKCSQAQSYHRNIHRYRKIHTVSVTLIFIRIAENKSLNDCTFPVLV